MLGGSFSGEQKLTVWVFVLHFCENYRVKSFTCKGCKDCGKGK